jgi:hypothetical protein
MVAAAKKMVIAFLLIMLFAFVDNKYATTLGDDGL